jgi:demethylmenaquinone methyltransferase/2-methoxy-6-polyprenyl-1,4-benzoquinol methylase
MNDLMSGGLHRVWKAFTIAISGVRPGQRVLDVAAGTGDLSRAFARKVGPAGLVVMSDINGSMLQAGRDRLIDSGVLVPTVLCDAEKLPFPDAQFDLVSVAFGLRNMTHKDAALRDMQRVLKPGGKLLVLEFSKPWAPLRGAYDLYSFQVLPRLGKMVAGDPQSYQYLAESIRMHPDQETLAGLMREAGFGHVDWHNLTAGVVALHIGQKF